MILTVDGNGHGLSQDVAILALESWDLAQLVELLVVVADALGWLGVNELEVKTVGLGDGEERSGARVALKEMVSEIVLLLIASCWVAAVCAPEYVSSVE